MAKYDDERIDGEEDYKPIDGGDDEMTEDEDPFLDDDMFGEDGDEEDEAFMSFHGFHETDEWN